jgi:NTP pyrophosphatase (non-canonical NTP hydrolase)
MIDIYALHRKLIGHLFSPRSKADERFLALALCGEAGELANMIKKRWLGNNDLSEEIRDEIADVRIYLELLAKCFGIEGAKLDHHVQKKLAKVAEKHHQLASSLDHLADDAVAMIIDDKSFTVKELKEMVLTGKIELRIR